MECLNPARGDRRKVTDGMRYPFALASFGDTVYYTDWQRFGLSFYRKCFGVFLKFGYLIFHAFYMQATMNYTDFLCFQRSRVIIY